MNGMIAGGAFNGRLLFHFTTDFFKESPKRFTAKPDDAILSAKEYHVFCRVRRPYVV